MIVVLDTSDMNTDCSRWRIEDDVYYLAVSRYAHLHPTPAVVPRPEQWKWSTFAGYVDPQFRLPRVGYDTLLDARQGGFGGGNPVDRYPLATAPTIRQEFVRNRSVSSRNPVNS